MKNKRTMDKIYLTYNDFLNLGTIIGYLITIKNVWTGESFEDSPINAWKCQTAEEDDADDDLYFASFEIGGIAISRYNILVNKEGIIEGIDLSDVDIYAENTLYTTLDITRQNFWDYVEVIEETD